MPFEPLETDEKLDAPPPKKRDMDTQMMFGCSTFGIVAGLILLLVALPHFLIADTQRLVELGRASLLGLAPAAVVGMVASRRFGLPGACGFVGGALVSAVFLYLRLAQVLLTRYGDPSEQPDYPVSWGTLLPIAWVAACAGLALLSMRRSDLPIE
ncbi:MAG: hypothetical protein M9921_02560 [Fimbriimonadaceae bacterium]|nr:hypothetical protein [Chthonomonadaceae bacterium]MCO5295714.1 hypothetical protein [Fimbriimonadaceae bacterium]